MELGLHIGLETDLPCRAFHFVPGLDSAFYPSVSLCVSRVCFREGVNATVSELTSGCEVQFIDVPLVYVFV